MIRTVCLFLFALLLAAGEMDPEAKPVTTLVVDDDGGIYLGLVDAVGTATDLVALPHEPLEEAVLTALPEGLPAGPSGNFLSRGIQDLEYDRAQTWAQITETEYRIAVLQQDMAESKAAMVQGAENLKVLDKQAETDPTHPDLGFRAGEQALQEVWQTRLTTLAARVEDTQTTLEQFKIRLTALTALRDDLGARLAAGAVGPAILATGRETGLVLVGRTGGGRPTERLPLISRHLATAAAQQALRTQAPEEAVSALMEAVQRLEVELQDAETFETGVASDYAIAEKTLSERRTLLDARDAQDQALRFALEKALREAPHQVDRLREQALEAQAAHRQALDDHITADAGLVKATAAMQAAQDQTEAARTRLRQIRLVAMALAAQP